MEIFNSVNKKRKSTTLLKIKQCSSLQARSKQSGMILVFVLIFLLALSLLAVSSISSSKLQLTLLNNQQMYLQAINQLGNAQQIIFSQLTGDIYSEQILNLNTVLDGNNKLPASSNSNSINNCDMLLASHWLYLGSAFITNNNIQAYLSVISIELIENENDNDVDINITSTRLETLFIKQCFALGNSDLWLLHTSIITRSGIDKFNISSTYENTEIKLVGN